MDMGGQSFDSVVDRQILFNIELIVTQSQQCNDFSSNSHIAGFVQDKDSDPFLSFLAVSGLDLRLPVRIPSPTAINFYEGNTSSTSFPAC